MPKTDGQERIEQKLWPKCLKGKRGQKGVGTKGRGRWKISLTGSCSGIWLYHANWLLWPETIDEIWL